MGFLEWEKLIVYMPSFPTSVVSIPENILYLSLPPPSLGYDACELGVSVFQWFGRQYFARNFLIDEKYKISICTSSVVYSKTQFNFDISLPLC